MKTCLTLPCSRLYRCVVRNIGRGVVRQRAAVEAGWQTYVQQVWSEWRVAACHCLTSNDIHNVPGAWPRHDSLTRDVHISALGPVADG